MSSGKNILEVRMKNNVTVRSMRQDDLSRLVAIWNEIVGDGVAFPQEDALTLESGKSFFESQSYVGVGELQGKVVGLYVLHPNNVGRCGHLCNTSCAVTSTARGRGVGEALVNDSLKKGKALGFRILQFNAVVESNESARRLYHKLGFIQLGVIPGGFRMKDGHYENICPYYHLL